MKRRNAFSLSLESLDSWLQFTPEEIARWRYPDKPTCGARTRKGTPCQRKFLLKGNRCPNHGGCSTGPRTPEGKQRIAEANRRRWAARRQAGAAG